MNIIIFGATGRTGKHLVAQALEAGHVVSVFCRNAEKLGAVADSVTVIEGNALDAEAVSAAVAGQEAVICALGMPSIRDNTGLRARATENIVTAMEAKGIQRLICLSSFGAGNSLSHMPFHYRYVLAPLFMRNLYRDHNRQEAHIRASSLDWTIVRPPILTDEDKTDVISHGTDKLIKAKFKISRANLASFMLQQLQDKLYLHAAPSVSE